MQQGCPFRQKSGWWNSPTIMLVQMGHSSSATIMAESERVLVEGDGHSSSAVKYSKEEDDWLELELFILDCSPAVLSLMTAGCFILQSMICILVFGNIYFILLIDFINSFDSQIFITKA